MDNLDWSKFNRRINIAKDESQIFNYWISQEKIERWFLSKAEFIDKNGKVKDRNREIEKGDRYVWIWHGSDDVAEGEILENNGKDFLEFTFLGCIVSVKVQIENSENVIELTQRSIALDEKSRMRDYVGCSGGWTFYLANLKSILEGGIDLRNRNNDLVDVINS
jgi:uncharacterized protein YndB with AHSA1/START domain